MESASQLLQAMLEAICIPVIIGVYMHVVGDIPSWVAWACVACILNE